MGWDFAQIKSTKEGYVTENHGYNERWIWQIKDLYETVLKKPFPITQINSEYYYDNCINSMYSKDKDLKELFKKYNKDLAAFSIDELLEFKNITIDKIKGYIKEQEDNSIEPDYSNNPAIQDFHNYMTYHEDVDKRLEEYQQVFDDIVKYAKEGYIYFYIVN